MVEQGLGVYIIWGWLGTVTRGFYRQTKMIEAAWCSEINPKAKKGKMRSILWYVHEK